MNKKYTICKECGASDSCQKVSWQEYREIKRKLNLTLKTKVKLLDKKRFERIIRVEEIKPIIHYCTSDGVVDFELFGEEHGIIVYKEINK